MPPVDTIRDHVLNNQAMNFAIFEMTGEDLEDTNDSLKGMMYTQFVKARKMCRKKLLRTKESARLKRFSSNDTTFGCFCRSTLLARKWWRRWYATQRFCAAFCRKSPHGRNGLRRNSNEKGSAKYNKKPSRKLRKNLSERSSISEHLKASLAIPTYEQHVLSKEGGYNDRGLFLHVGAGAKDPQGSVRLETKRLRKRAMGRSWIQSRRTLLEEILKRPNC